ncbi:hypothetical protein [Halorussus caseinilyticus]|uniref:Uncharacterized protein n=1 Tax=Halorussus caseinilyticus TaxID=3034025 RepID=A0ABD5WPA4_9EURY
MRIETLTCPVCRTVVAANVLESNRVMKCPGNGCESVLRFEDLPEAVQDHYVENRTDYRVE